MATLRSKQTQQWEVMGNAPLKTNELHGRVRVAYFQFQADRDGVVDGVAVVAQNDMIRLCQIPAGARLLGGKVKNGAFGASCTLDIGLAALDGSGYIDTALTVADDPDAIATLVAIATASAPAFDIIEEPAYFGYETQKELDLTCTFKGANPADNIELSGYITYVVD